MKTDVVLGMSALNVNDVVNRIGEINVGNINGHFLDGLGVVRLEGYGDHVYVTVAVRDMPIKICPTCNKQALIRRTTEKTVHNPNNGLYYGCGTLFCGFNIYPEYPIVQFQQNRTDAVANGVDHPILSNLDTVVLPSNTVQ